MTLEEFNKKYDWLDDVNVNEDYVGSFMRRLGLCRRFFRENRYTLTDEALKQVLLKYLQCLNTNPDDNAELGQIVELREQVCRRLAKQSFENYGEDWAEALYDRAFYGNQPDSLADYDACIAVWERIMQEFGRKRELSIANCCFHAAVDCDCNDMYGKSIEYIERALDLYQNMEYESYNIKRSIAMCHKVAADALMELGRYDEADEHVESAMEVFHKWGEKFIKANVSSVITDIYLNECDKLRKKIKDRREKAETNKNQLTI